MLRSFIFVIFLALSPVTVAADAIKTVTLEVLGMNCAACPIAVKKGVEESPWCVQRQSGLQIRNCRGQFRPKHNQSGRIGASCNNSGIPDNR